MKAIKIMMRSLKKKKRLLKIQYKNAHEGIDQAELKGELKGITLAINMIEYAIKYK